MFSAFTDHFFNEKVKYLNEYFIEKCKRTKVVMQSQKFRLKKHINKKGVAIDPTCI